MHKNIVSALALACAAACMPVQAAVTLIAKGTLDPNGADLSGLTYTGERPAGQPAGRHRLRACLGRWQHFPVGP